ncbi:mu-type opioid receptor [Tetranychus urticae]|uniref:Thyrotropin-releasing hormone receptor n=1 Tax=Tetranychus urticae TaxID=32264 RepID=T1KU41_TETUR|nr:mu-type opioid receptor [Tetranychus urticae]
MFMLIFLVTTIWIILSICCCCVQLTKITKESTKMDPFFNTFDNLPLFSNDSLLESLNTTDLANSLLAGCDYVTDTANRLTDNSSTLLTSSSSSLVSLFSSSLALNSPSSPYFQSSPLSSSSSSSPYPSPLSLSSSSILSSASSSSVLSLSPSSSISSSSLNSANSYDPATGTASPAVVAAAAGFSPETYCNNLNTTFCKDPSYYAISYRIIGTIFQGFILIIGVLGNIMVVIVVVKTRSMRTPTNCYLVSLSIADLMVLIAAVPNEIIAYYVLGDQWIWGRVGCALFIFFQYLGIDASSLSITAFTVERYIAICHPMKAQKVCTVHRAKRIILNVWIFACLYNSPWFFLTKTEPICYRSLEDSNLETCTFAWSRKYYLGYFFSDLVLFYIFPLLLSCVLYGLMARVLFNNPLSKTMGASTSSSSSTSTIITGITAKSNQANSSSTSNHSHTNNTHHHHQSSHSTSQTLAQSTHSKKISSQSNDSSRVQVVKMLVVIVAVFATLWLPYRALLVYNSMTDDRYMELWYLMFCKTMIFVNSAINPILYNALSVKFRRAFKRMLSCETRKRRRHFDVPLASIHVSLGNSIRNNNVQSNTFAINNITNSNNNNNNINNANGNGTSNNNNDNENETNNVNNVNNSNVDHSFNSNHVHSGSKQGKTTTASTANQINSSNGPKILRFTVQRSSDHCKQAIEAL